MKNISTLILGLALVVGLSACGATKESLGLNKKAPNEFMVTPNKPLCLPPEYELRPVVEPKQEVLTKDNGLTASDNSLLEEMKSN